MGWVEVVGYGFDGLIQVIWVEVVGCGLWLDHGLRLRLGFDLD